MASIAQDHQGNIALGYNVSSGSVFPSVRYTGRLAGDAPNQMTFNEATLIAGNGSQTGSSRWGDYSSLTVDPEDDCTFWLTAEYIPVSSGTGWRTRIGSFRFPTCSLGPRGLLQGVVSDTVTTQPLGGALVTASAFPTQTYSTLSIGSGSYAFSLPEGAYTVTAAQYGYTTASVSGISVTINATTTLNLPLSPAPQHVVSGVVTDVGSGNPLWATLTIDGHPFDPPTATLQTDAVTGFYSLTVPGGGQAYTLTVTALQHLPSVRSLGLVNSDQVENFALTATTTAGALAGYVNSDYLNGPLAGALVTVAAAGTPSDTTDAEGYYEILNLPAGSYTATASAAGYSPHTAGGLTVLTSAITRQDFTLTTGRVSVAPGVLTRTRAAGAVLVDPAGLVITNTGAGVLAYALREQAVGFTPAGPAAPDGGGPDSFGHTWRTSNELNGPVFEWLDATGGTALTLTDDSAENITLPFPFPFYSTTSTALRVGNNGAILFNNNSATVAAGNAALATTPVRNLIAPFWDDLDTEIGGIETGGVYWQVFGVAPNRRVVIEWHDRPRWEFTGGVGTATFEAVLFEDGDILFQYLDVDFGVATYNAGNSATVGLRGPGAADFLQFSHNTPSLASNLAICFDRPGSLTACGLGDALPWLTAAPVSGSLPGGVNASQMFSLTWSTVFTSAAPGQYRGNLWLVTSDPVMPNHYLPVTLTVLPPALQWATAAQTVTERVEPVTATVNLSAALGVTVTVPYTVSGTAAGSGVDHDLANGALSVPPGATTVALSFRVGLDLLAEPDETIVITLGAPANATLAAPITHTVTVVDFPLPYKRYFPIFPN